MIVTITLNPAIDQTVGLDYLKPGLVNKVDHPVTTAGGKGINVARVLADLQMSVTATGLMGKESKDFFSEYLHQNGIKDQFVLLDGKTRTNIKLVNRSDSEVTDINFPGFKAEAHHLDDILDVLAEYPKDTIILVAGSLPQGIDQQAFSKFLRQIKAYGFKLAIDTSGEALATAIKVKPDLIKPNIHELEELAGQSLSVDEALAFCQQLLTKGVGQIALSMGSEGAWFVAEQQRTFAKPSSVKVISSVGAGDSMMAGVLYGMYQKLSQEEISKLATACAMMAVSQAGVGLSSSDELEGLKKTVHVSTETVLIKQH